MRPSRYNCMDDLTIAYILKEYADWLPAEETAAGWMNREEKAIEKYRNHPIFRSRVERMVAVTMNIVDRHAEFKED